MYWCTFGPTVHSSPKVLESCSSKSSTDGSQSVSDHYTRPSGTNLRVAVLNANSIKGKRAMLAAVCDSIDPDVILVTETKLDSSMSSSEFLPKNYLAHRLDRDVNGGGVMVAVRNIYAVDEVTINQVNCEFVCVRIAIQKSNPLYVAAYCRPPDELTAQLDGFEAVLEHLQSKLNRNGKATLLVGGDFNVGDVNWDSLAMKVDSKKKSACNRMLDIITGAQLTQLQKEPTCQDQVLDLLCTSTCLQSFTLEVHHDHSRNL